jgi:hypothetical protein
MLEAVPLINMETATCRDALIRHWICRFGVPAYLTSDQGVQFTFALIRHWVARFGVLAHLTSDQGAQFSSALWARTCDVIGTHHNKPRPTTPRATGWWRGPTGG